MVKKEAVMFDIAVHYPKTPEKSRIYENGLLTYMLRQSYSASKNCPARKSRNSNYMTK